LELCIGTGCAFRCCDCSTQIYSTVLVRSLTGFPGLNPDLRLKQSWAVLAYVIFKMAYYYQKSEAAKVHTTQPVGNLTKLQTPILQTSPGPTSTSGSRANHGIDVRTPHTEALKIRRMHPRLRVPITPTSVSKISPPKPVLNFYRAYAAGPKGAGKKDGKKKKKKKGGDEFIQHDLKDALQFSLAEAMRYIRAMEVGQNPISAKYDLAVRLRTPKTSPIIRNRIRLPTPVKTDKRVCVIAEGEHAEAARQAGAAIVGTDEVFEQVGGDVLSYRGSARFSC
jgi:hypothetical protein